MCFFDGAKVAIFLHIIKDCVIFVANKMSYDNQIRNIVAPE